MDATSPTDRSTQSEASMPRTADEASIRGEVEAVELTGVGEDVGTHALAQDVEGVERAGERSVHDSSGGGEVFDGEGDDDDAQPDEGDIAGDYLEDLLDIADIDGDFDIDEVNGRMLVSISSDAENSNLGKLSAGDTVEALQHLTRLAVQAETGELSRLILDVGGSRDSRRAELAKLVDSAVEKLQQGAAKAALPPMSSYERKIVHDLAAEHGCDSESEGEGRDRHPVLTLR